MPKNDSGPSDALRGLTPESEELQPESIESRAQLDGFVDTSLSSRTIGKRVSPAVYLIDADRTFQKATATQLVRAGFIVAPVWLSSGAWDFSAFVSRHRPGNRSIIISDVPLRIFEYRIQGALIGCGDWKHDGYEI
jgi:hypothetical protein